MKLPVNLDMMMTMRDRLWKNQIWDKKGAENMMSYIGSMWGMEVLARKSEYTLHGQGCADHCVRAREVSFLLSVPISVEGSIVSSISGGEFSSVGGKRYGCRGLHDRRVFTQERVTAEDQGGRETSRWGG